MWEGSYEDLQRAAEDVDSPPTTLIGDAMEALLGYIRCSKCTMPVPVEFGNLAGMDPIEAIAGAVREAHAQRCWAYEGVERVKRPNHKPVKIGTPPAGIVSATPEPLQRARARAGSGARTFMAPGSEPHVTPVPEVPVRHKKGQR